MPHSCENMRFSLLRKQCPTPQKKQRSKALGINGTHPWIFLLEFLWVNLHAVGFPGGLPGKKSVCNAGDLGSIPGYGRSPRKGKGYPLQYSCLENSMDRGAWQAIVLLLSRFSRVRLLATPWTSAYQAPPSMGFSRQEYWSGVPLPSPRL